MPARTRSAVRAAAADPQAILRDLQDLNPGAPVVHEEYGVGRYLGLMPMEVGGQPGEFLVLEYRDGDRIYVPVHALHLVSRYTGAAPEHAPLHKLGTDQWARARRRAAEQIRDVAAELLDLHARRKAQPGLALPLPELEYQAFASAFPFEETADQGQAIRQVLSDLAAARPMDRIVCGDVGFGKTEVAMRAAFVAAHAGKQVAVLAPTTLLVQQHLHQLPRPLRRLAGARRGAVALRQCQGDAGGARRPRAGHGRHRHRHASAAARAGALPRSGPADHR